jgi:DNA (cytosine-5)-methyltransferase 1
MMRRRASSYGAGLFHGLVVDLFAGGGGASLGIERALGRGVDLAINHDPHAIAMHRANHPATRHLIEDVFAVDPHEATGGRPVVLLWCSPDCKHFSKAKGGKPVSSKIRGLAWIAVRWAAAKRPRVIIIENVEEFVTWGPLTADNRPCPRRKGQTFKLWVSQLQALGYAVEWRELRACDYGAPTIRKRLIVVARCDGRLIIWPEVTHAEVGACQNWCHIADGVVQGNRVRTSPDSAGALVSMHGDGPPETKIRPHATRSELYADDRQRCGDRGDGVGLPGGRTGSLRAPRTARSNAHNMACDEGACRSQKGSAAEALRRLTPYRAAAECIDWSLPCPSIFERRRPLAENTLRRIANGIRRYVIDAAEPFIVTCNHSGPEFRGQDLRTPLRTVTAARDATGLVVPYTVPRYGERAGQSPRCRGVDRPLPVVTPTANHAHLVAALLTHMYTSNTNGGNGDLRQPMKTVTAGLKYYGTATAQSLREPLHTVTSKHRLGLVTVANEDYQIVDIGMRMLTPRELARAQGFPDDYELIGTKTRQIAMIGNSVCPDVAEAVVRANVIEAAEGVV